MASAEPPLPPQPQPLLLAPLAIALCIVSVAAISLITLHLLISKFCAATPPPTSDGGATNKKLLLDSIPIRAYTKNPESSETDCSVCLGVFEEGEPVRVLPGCRHVFHVPCIDVWLVAHSNCPLCRSDVAAPEFVALSVEEMGGGTTRRDREDGGALIGRSGSSVWPSTGSFRLLPFREKLQLKRFSSMSLSCNVDREMEHQPSASVSSRIDV